ncbi:uncharacterized protein LOC143067790 isoform X2 [Mytilus galloprovincialis]|uniref:uncharacterized protein LOC143067790 isoform X2 n=1 Tax=Mytilus galloprovincialis TaxID=29158 RepID=UPI003F7B6614
MSSCMSSCLNQQYHEYSELKITEELKNIKFEESNSVLFECTVSKKKSRATWLKDGKQIQTSDMSYDCQSEANIHSLKIEKANLQDVGTYTVIIEDKFSSATLFKEEESSQPQSVPSMENKDADSGKFVNLQRKEEHIDDDEHLPAVLMGNTKPLPIEQENTVFIRLLTTAQIIRYQDQITKINFI